MGFVLNLNFQEKWTMKFVNSTMTIYSKTIKSVRTMTWSNYHKGSMSTENISQLYYEKLPASIISVQVQKRF